MRFSANLGFLWADLALDAAIWAAHRAGFAAVECHFPYEHPPAKVADALAGTGLEMLSLNTAPGPFGSFGLAAIPGREKEARVAIDAALYYADAVDAHAVHVLAGQAVGDAARKAYCENLRYAAAHTDRMILIEPLNPQDMPGYFLSDFTQAAEITEKLDRPNLRLMFDLYHAAMMGEDIMAQLSAFLPLIGHIQFASAPGRGRPDEGNVDIKSALEWLSERGWTQPFGAEYQPQGPTEESLGWMQNFGLRKG